MLQLWAIDQQLRADKNKTHKTSTTSGWNTVYRGTALNASQKRIEWAEWAPFPCHVYCRHPVFCTDKGGQKSWNFADVTCAWTPYLADVGCLPDRPLSCTATQLQKAGHNDVVWCQGIIFPLCLDQMRSQSVVQNLESWLCHAEVSPVIKV